MILDYVQSLQEIIKELTRDNIQFMVSMLPHSEITLDEKIDFTKERVSPLISIQTVFHWLANNSIYNKNIVQEQGPQKSDSIHVQGQTPGSKQRKLKIQHSQAHLQKDVLSNNYLLKSKQSQFQKFN